jgi:hypothetical protein
MFEDPELNLKDNLDQKGGKTFLPQHSGLFKIKINPGDLADSGLER